MNINEINAGGGEYTGGDAGGEIMEFHEIP